MTLDPCKSVRVMVMNIATRVMFTALSCAFVNA